MDPASNALSCGRAIALRLQLTPCLQGINSREGVGYESYIKPWVLSYSQGAKSCYELPTSHVRPIRYLTLNPFITLLTVILHRVLRLSYTSNTT